jgi:predicted ATPase/DNA-binding NarL/FixJ family response regulator
VGVIGTVGCDIFEVSGAPLRGRDGDVAAVLDRLRRPGTRTVTITGRGGVGKSAVAREVAGRLAEERAVAVVRLDGVPGADLVLDTIAAALGVVPAAGQVLESIAARVGRGVLVLDGLEHLRSAAPLLADLVARAPDLLLLVTSQAPLRIPAEHVISLAPLPVPSPGARDVGALVEVPSVQLYCDRAAAADRRFQLDETNAAEVATLCRRLDGLPLAIEIAAARAPTMRAADVVSRLDAATLDMLRLADPDGPAYRRSMRNTIGWSVDLLGEEQRRLLWRLSVVSGPFDLDVVEALCDGSTLDDLAALVDLHLVDPRPAAGEATFVLPQLIRTFATERLRAAGAEEGTRVAHRKATAVWARRAAIGAETPDEPLWLRRIGTRHDDLLACLTDALRADDAADALDIVNGLAPYWKATGYRASHDRLVRSALDMAAEQDVVSGAHASAAASWAMLAIQQQFADDLDQRLASLALAEGMADELGVVDVRLRVLACRVLVSPYDPDRVAGAAAGRTGLELAGDHASPRWLASFEVWNGMLAHQAGDADRAVELGLLGLGRARDAGDERSQLLAGMLLLPLRVSHPELADVIPTATALVELARRSGHRLLADVLVPAAVAEALAAGDLDVAGHLVADGLVVARSAPKVLAGFLLDAAARWLGACGDHEEVAWLEAVLEPDLALLDATSARSHVAIRRSVFESARAALPDGGGAARLRAVGLSWPAAAHAAEAIVRRQLAARSVAPRVVEPDPSPHGGRGPLTPRQADVLRLAAEGLSNREIGQELGLTPKTVMHHLNAVYLTTGARGRTEAAAREFHTGLVS